MLNIAIKKGIISCALTAALGGCGGGSGSKLDQFTGDGNWQAGVFNSASYFANKCEIPREGIDLYTKKSFPDRQGTLRDENNFLRSWSNDTYLWYREIIDQDPADFSSTFAYFDTLKTLEKTASGKSKDNFHFTYTTTVWDGLINSGVDTGYGISWAWLSSDRPRHVVVSFTEPGSPAARRNLQRGAKLLAVDGIDFVNAENIDALERSLYPSAHDETHTIEVLDLGATQSRTIQLKSEAITKAPVQSVKVISTNSGNVGYFLFNDHLATAERGLVDAVNRLKQGDIVDLVLDLRYNSGGYLYIASELAYMIAGYNATDNKIFEKTTFNDKHKTKDLSGDTLQPIPFSSTAEAGDALPTLTLPRVFIITSGNTCSASESVINSLRGINVEVIQIGSKTCGKPYGFYARDNCGTTYFTIQFKGVNHKGFGEYADGFAPSQTDNGLDNVKGCYQGDDFTHLLGDPAELNLASALYYRDQGKCPISASEGAMQKLSEGDYRNMRATINKEPGLSNRIMR